MRIGIVTGEYPPMQGGVGAYTQILAATFAAQGHTIFVLTNTKAAQSTLHHPDISVQATVTRWNISSLQHIRHWVRAHQLDIISLQFETAAYGMSPWIHFLPDFLRDIPIVTTFHDLRVPYLFPKAGKLRQWIVMHLARRSSGVIATNHEDMLRLQHLDHATLIPIGSNISTDVPATFERTLWRKQADACNSDFLIAYFGFLNRSKGVETLLQAVKQLIQDGFPVKVMMIGGRTGSSDPANAAYAQEIEALIAQLDIERFIYWTGFVTEQQVTAYLYASDAVVLPFLDGASYRRGSLMAAIQHECAVITTEPAVPIPTFQHAENMLLFPPGNVEQLVSCIQSLQSSPAVQEQLRQGVSRIKSQFDWDQIAHDYIRLFEQVIA